MKALLSTLILLALAVPGAVVQAEIVGNLYEARVPVEQRGGVALKRAATEGLAQVLVRVSGSAEVTQHSSVQQALRSAQSILRQYRYDTELEAGNEQLYLALSFNETEVNRLLFQAGLPVWDKNRPQVLVWLVADDVQGRRFVSGDTHPEIVEQLNEAARRRGLALVFPTLDIDDKLLLNTGQVWAMDLDAVRRAAERYRTQWVLTGRLTRLSRGWIGNLAYLSADDETFIDRQSDGLADVLGPPIDAVADDLARRYAIVRSTEQPDRRHIVVSGIDSFRDYARLLTYLESVAVIEHANPLWVSGPQMVVTLYLQDSMEKAQRFFVLDKKIVEDDNPSLAFVESHVPREQIHSYYRWRELP